MIKTFEQLGEVLAEFENRLSLIENSLPNSQPENKISEEPKPQEILHRHINYNSDVSKKQWGRIDAISGELKYLREKHAEMMTALDKLQKKEKEIPF